MNAEIPDSKRVFQTAAWMWVIYLVSMAVVDIFIYGSRLNIDVLWYHLINSIPALIFLGLSRSKWLNERGNLVAPLLILLITAGPILMNYLFNLHLPQAPLSNLEGMVMRQLPILLIGLVLVASNYNLRTMLLYSLGTNLFELALVFSFRFLGEDRLGSFYFVIVIRMVCFIVIGIFINQLITRLREQQESLKSANNRLAHYASTLETLTVSRERNRMSRELHDTVVHTLSGLSVQLETIKAYWDVDPVTAQDLLGKSLATTRSGLQETRRAIKALRASPLDDLGLLKGIQNLAENAAQRSQLEVELSLPTHAFFVPPDVEQCLYRVAQEALENVVHHANARRLIVKLDVNPEGVTLAIQDDGVGFHPDGSHPSGHYGIPGMKERVSLVGGDLTITSEPNCGTLIQLVIKGYQQ
jgi:signal transduction histidine kinase